MDCVLTVVLAVITRVQPLCPTTVFAIVVNEHVVRYREVRSLHADLRRYDNLSGTN